MIDQCKATYSMRIISLILISLVSTIAYTQSIRLKLQEKAPYKITDTIHFEVYLSNTTVDTLVYFDGRGLSYNCFEELWETNVTHQVVEMVPLKDLMEGEYTTETIVSLAPGENRLLKTQARVLDEIGDYSVTYTHEQNPKTVKKLFAASDSAYLLSQTITPFKVVGNIKFEVLEKYSSAITEFNTMTWEEWKDFRHQKLYSSNKHFDNIFLAHKKTQDVYSLTLYCDGLDENMIKRISHFKNLRALTLRNYKLDYFPKELAEMDLFELILIPKNEDSISFEYGVSKNKTLRELTTKIYGDFPLKVLELEELLYLDINKCSVNAFPDLSPLKKLEVLIANEINLASLNHIGIEKLQSLKELNLSGNRRLDNISPILNCSNLEFLIMNRTNVLVIPHEIEQLSKLKKMSVSSSLINVSDSIGNLHDLRYLSFGGNRKLDSIPSSILKLSKLVHLDLSSTNIPELPEDLVELPLAKVLIYNTECKQTKDYKALKKRLGVNFKD